MFFEHPITRAIALIGINSPRRNRRISAQSSTLNTRFLLSLNEEQGPPGGQNSPDATGSAFTRR